MRLTFLIAIMATTSFPSIGQNIYVADSLSLEKLPYASISYQKIKGQLCVRISNIGYQTKTIAQSSLPDTILLAPISYQISEVIVNAKKKNKYYPLGYHKQLRLFTNGFTTSSFPHRILAASKINSPNQRDLVEGVYMPIWSVNEESKFILFLMSVGLDGLPGDTLLKKNLDANEYNRKIYVDVKEHYLKIPQNGIFIVFEWITKNSDSQENITIVTTKRFEANNSYYFSHGSWKSYYHKEDPFNNFAFGFKMRKE